MSNNLGLPQVAAAQNQKEVTINDQAGGIDAALTESLAVDVSTVNGAVSSMQFTRCVFIVAAGAAVPRNVSIPAIKKLFLARNSGSADVTFTLGASNVTIPAGAGKVLYSDGTALFTF